MHTISKRVSIFSFRKFINDHVVDFAKQNPSIALYVRERPSRHPRFVAEYCKLLVKGTIAPLPSQTYSTCSEWKKPSGLC